MQGTLVCGLTGSDDGRSALELAVALSERLGLRLVLAHASGALRGGDGDGDVGRESVSIDAERVHAAHLLSRLAGEYGVAGTAECRHRPGDPAGVIGSIAAEEAAALIVVGARPRGRLRRGLESRLAEQLECETPVPVLIAPPRTRRAARMVA